MDNVSPNSMSEICLVLIAEPSEFVVERAIINDLMCPSLRRYFMSEFQIEFNVIDFYQDCNCKNVPNVDRQELLLSELKRAQKISSGLSSLIMLGEQCGELTAPRKLTGVQFRHVLDFLQSKKDPTWKTFSSKYSKSKTSDDYLVDENLTDEETYSILNGLESSISSNPNEIFSETFIFDHLTLLIEKCIPIATLDRSTIACTHVIRRNVNNTYVVDSFTKPETQIQRYLKERYDALLKSTRKKCLPNNFLEYTISNMTLLEAEREILKNKGKLIEIGESWNIFSAKVRSLSKDLRVSSSSDLYLQIFLEHICKIIRENSVNLLLKRDISKDKLTIETLSHILQNDKIDNEELVTTLNKERERERGIFQNYFTSNIAKMPGLIFGPTGSGKTTLILDLLSKMERKSTTVLIIRHCGKTVSSSNLQLLLCSISDQINSFLTKKPFSSNACEYAVCVYDFWMSLNKAGTSKQIVLFLDDVENLFPSSHTDMVKWLPPSLPNGVKVILTSSSESFYQGFKKRYEVSNIINLSKMDPKDSIRILPNLCKKYGNNPISEAVFNQANFCLQENSTPLYLSLLSQCIGSLKNPDLLVPDTKAVFKIYLEQHQTTLNNVILKHILSYLALSRFGLSLSELTDILSLDNKILSTLEFNVEAKVTFKFPTYLTIHFLNQCKSILSLIHENGKLLIKLKHQIFISSIIEHFQLAQDDGKFFYQTLYDYWTSRYSGDKLKPTFDKASDDDENLPAEASHLYVKRGIASQPYYTMAKNRDIISNQRKLVELPALLIKFEKTNELYKLVLFNFEYLFSTLHCFGINNLISELYFTRQLGEIKNNTELELLLAQLRLLSSEVIADAKLLAPEISGRLSHLIGANALLSQLHQQIDTGGTKINAIFAAIPCYPTIDIENMRVEIGLNKELLFSNLSPDNRFISTFIKDNTTKDFLIIIWDSRSATKSQIINLGKFLNTKFNSMFYMPQSDEYLILQFEETTSSGFFIVNLEFSSIENTIKFAKNASIKIENASKSHFYLSVNGELQVYTHPTAQLDIGITRMPYPSHMTPNDRYLIGPRPITNKPSDSNKNTFNLRVMNAVTGEVLCHLSMNMTTSCLLANVRNESLFVGTKAHGIIHRFDIGQIAKKDVKSLKSNLELKLGDQSVLSDDMRDYLVRFYPNIKVTKFQLSVDERFLISEYLFNDSFRAFALWNISNKTMIRGKILDVSATISFSADGQYVYYYQRKGTLNIFNLQNSIEYNLLLRDIPEQIFMLRTGSFIMAFPKSIKLTTLKAVLQDCGNEDNSLTFQPETFCTTLKKPKLSKENIVIYSNNEETSTFLYFKLASNSIMSLDISHTNDSLTEFSTDRFLSPDGGKLLLVFGFKLANLMITDQEYDIDVLTMNLGPNGKLISNLNDYRKPQIPRENYFTGNDSTKPNNNSSAYNQKIVKVIDLKSFKTFFQVSLCGEEIFKFTDTLLLTFKPDYASLTRTCDDSFDIVSIYDVIGARYVSSLHLEHPVIDSTLLPSDKDKLLICCGYGGKFLKLLGGEYFSTVLYKIDVHTMLRYYDEFARNPCITRMFTFFDNPNSLLLQFSWFDSNGSMKVEKDTYYAKIETVKKEVVCQFTSPGKVTDVTSNGSLAIDSSLNMYDLHKGNVLRNLQASIGRLDDSDSVTYVNLFSRDNNHIVTLDSDNKLIWVIKNDEHCLTVGKALLTSSFEDGTLSSQLKMELALDGQLVIVYNDLEFKIFVIKLSQKSIISEYNYKSNIERIKKILLP